MSAALKIIQMHPVSENTNEAKKPKGGGHVKIFRSLKNHWLWKSSKKKSKLEAWLDLLMLAQFEDTKEAFGTDLIMLKKGQILTSQETLSKEWRWDRNAVRAFLRMLSDDAMIEVRSTVKFTMITICNYTSYHENLPTGRRQKGDRKATGSHIQELKELKEDSVGEATPAIRPEDLEWNNLQTWISNNAKRVAAMPEPLNKEQYFKLKAKHDKQTIARILGEMHNWAKLKERTSAFLTFQTFAKRDNGSQQTTSQPKQAPTSTAPPLKTAADFQNQRQ